MGAQGSFLGASTGPIRSMPDGRGRYVAYQGGRIWWTSAHGAVAMTSAANAPLVATGVSRLGYPSGPRVDGLTDSGWLHPCEKGAVVDSASTSPQAVWGSRWTTWVGAGREKGVLGYPVAAVVVYPDGGWIQVFQRGAIALGASGPSAVVHGTVWQAWLAVGREDGPLGFPRADRVAVTGGYSQAFRRGGVWGRDGGPAFAVYGGVLDQWLAAGGPGGTYGFPTAHAVLVDGLLIGRFEGGTITHRVGPPRPNRSRSLVD
jgi:uncharacterized protein with LGFP repeats